MKIKISLFFMLFCLSCSTIKNVQENDGTINIGNSNFIFSSPDSSRHYSRQEIEIQITNLRKEIVIIEKSISETKNNQGGSSRLPDKKKDLKKLEQRKDKYQKILKEWEELTE